MSTDHWMPLYVGDYLADTGHLSVCEHGAYLLLLMHYWRNGPLPDNDKQLAQIARTDRQTWDSEVGPTLRAFFVECNGRLHQKRADAERARAEEVSSKRRAAAENRWNKNNNLPPTKPNGVHPPDANASPNASAQVDAFGHPKAPANHSQMQTQLQPQSQIDLEAEEGRKEESKPSLPFPCPARENPEPPLAAQLAVENILGRLTRSLASTATHAQPKPPVRTRAQQQLAAVSRLQPGEHEEAEPAGYLRRGPVDPIRTVAEQLAILRGEAA